MEKNIWKIKYKSRFKKVNILDTILVWILYILQWVFLIIKATLPVLACSILYYRLEKVGYLQDINEELLCNVAIAIFGFQITFFSIVLSNKNNKVLNEKEIELNLFTNFFGQTINYYLIIAVSSLFGLILNMLTGKSAIHSCINLIVYSIGILIYSYYILKTSKAKLYFNKLKNQFKYMTKNRNHHKGNFINFVKDWDDCNINVAYALKKGLDYNSSNTWLLWSEMKKYLFYTNTENSDFYIELFNYSSGYYFNNFHNDSNVILLSIIFDELKKIIQELDKKNNYYAVIEIYKKFLHNYEEFLRSTFINNTFVNVKIIYKKIKDNEYLLNYIKRNNYLLSFLDNAFVSAKEITTILRDENYLDSDIDDVNMCISNIEKRLKNLEENNNVT